jgi:hypothetical protein
MQVDTALVLGGRLALHDDFFFGFGFDVDVVGFPVAREPAGPELQITAFPADLHLAGVVEPVIPEQGAVGVVVVDGDVRVVTVLVDLVHGLWAEPEDESAAVVEVAVQIPDLRMARCAALQLAYRTASLDLRADRGDRQVDPAATVSGQYWHHRQPLTPARKASDPRFQDRLLKRFAELTGVTLF